MSPAQPLVSVVVPVRDDERRLERCLTALGAQSYPSDRFEVVVVDNGSRDGSGDVARAHGAVCETETTVGSYAARNRGVEVAKGDILAFTDADCLPEPGWLQALVDQLARGADLVGGQVRFSVDGSSRGAELFDSLSSMQIGRNIRERGVAKTANLACWRRVFDKVGAFPAEMRSGGDIAWTRSASQAGCALVYAHDAVVGHPPRALRALLAKHFRVGKGQPRAWQRSGRSRKGYARATVRLLSPGHRPATLRRELRDRGIEVGAVRSAAVLGAGWLARLAQFSGNVAGLAACRALPKGGRNA